MDLWEKLRTSVQEEAAEIRGPADEAGRQRGMQCLTACEATGSIALLSLLMRPYNIRNGAWRIGALGSISMQS